MRTSETYYTIVKRRAHFNSIYKLLLVTISSTTNSVEDMSSVYVQGTQSKNIFVPMLSTVQKNDDILLIEFTITEYEKPT